VIATPVFFGNDKPPGEAAKVARIFNDLTLALAQGAPDRLIPFCQVPLQDADLACEELDRCRANGHAGVEIGSHVGDRDLDDAGIVEFLHHCASTGTPVFVHPWDMPSEPRLNRWMGQWLVGMPAETHLSILALILGGVFDRVPDTLRIAFAHGGGSFPFWLGRADNAWHKRHDVVRGGSVNPPSHYVDRFYVGGGLQPAGLRLLVGVMGEDRVLLGRLSPAGRTARPAGRCGAAVLTPAQGETVGQRRFAISGEMMDDGTTQPGRTYPAWVVASVQCLDRGAQLPDLALSRDRLLRVRRPAVVLLHGGFWRPQWDRTHLRPMAAALADAGWPVFLPEYRRIPGVPSATVDDVREAIDAVGRNVIVMGHSAGGHLALLVAPPHRIATIALAPVADSPSPASSTSTTARSTTSSCAAAPASSPPADAVLLHGTDDARTDPCRAYAATSGTRLVRVGAGHFALIDHGGAWPSVIGGLNRLLA
jgi:aminocarboxymuconate-semialdehyde decarboxylase